MLFKKLIKTVPFYSPLKGKLIPLNEVNDDAFAEGMLGKGFAIVPYSDVLYMPFDGEVIMIFKTLHAIGIKDCKGNEYLIHIGIDTVNLEGEGFQSFVKEGKRVKKGEKLIEFPLNEIKNKGYDPTVMIVATNFDSEEFELSEHRDVEITDKLLEI